MGWIEYLLPTKVPRVERNVLGSRETHATLDIYTVSADILLTRYTVALLSKALE